MKKKIVVVSVFDGMGCLAIALKELGYEVEYYASENDKYAIEQTKHNFKDIVHLGDVEKVRYEKGVLYSENGNFNVPYVDFFAGGSPCTGFSFAGKGLNFEDPQSKLFFEYVRLKNEIQPRFFLLENVNMLKEYLAIISDMVRIMPVRLNSSKISAQNRDRWYWSNVQTREALFAATLYTDIPEPEDKGIVLEDILQPEDEVDEKYYINMNNRTEKMISRILNNVRSEKGKSNCLTATSYKGAGSNGMTNVVCVAMRGRNPNNPNDRRTGSPTEQRLEPQRDGKTNCLTSVAKDNLVLVGDVLRRLTEIECARLQTVPEWYEFICSPTQTLKMLGNGWTVDMIIHILSHMKL